MKLKQNFFLLLMLSIIALMTSCGTSKIYMARYDVGLTSVETPSDAKDPYGELKITKVEDQTTDEKNNLLLINRYEYSDKYIGITWTYNTTQFEFELKNLSGHTIRINWDDVTFMDYSGNISRVMHKGVKYVERENPQGSISIPNGGILQDIIVPNSNVYFSKGISGYTPSQWKQAAIIPCYFNNKEDMENAILNEIWIGKTVRILFPMEIEGVKNDYTFEFTVNGTY